MMFSTPESQVANAAGDCGGPPWEHTMSAAEKGGLPFPGLFFLQSVRHPDTQ